MAQESSLGSLGAFRAQHARLIAELCEAATCARWGLPEEDFAAGLWRSAAKRFGAIQAKAQDVENYLKSLCLQDLALACACQQGLEKAWEYFVANFRQDMRVAASAILRGSGVSDAARATELADSLFAELYGLRTGTDGRRKSLLEYFHGRSKLSTWLHAVLAQRQVDMLRTSSRAVSFDDAGGDDSPREIVPGANPIPADPDRELYLRRIDQALAAALAALAPRERMLLACYYVDQLTLAEIGRLLHEHESTVSRQLERTRRALRESVTKSLQTEIPARNGRLTEAALDPAQIELAFEYAMEDWPFDLSRALSAADAAGDPPEESKSKR